MYGWITFHDVKLGKERAFEINGGNITEVDPLKGFKSPDVSHGDTVMEPTPVSSYVRNVFFCVEETIRKQCDMLPGPEDFEKTFLELYPSSKFSFKECGTDDLLGFDYLQLICVYKSQSNKWRVTCVPFFYAVPLNAQVFSWRPRKLSGQNGFIQIGVSNGEYEIFDMNGLRMF